MKIVQLRCPSCGAVLEAEDGLEVFFCKYCGQRIVLSVQSPAALNAKVAVKRMAHDERMQMNDLDHETEMYKLKMEEKRRKDVQSMIAIAVCIILIILLMLFIHMNAIREG